MSTPQGVKFRGVVAWIENTSGRQSRACITSYDESANELRVDLYVPPSTTSGALARRAFYLGWKNGNDEEPMSAVCNVTISPWYDGNVWQEAHELTRVMDAGTAKTQTQSSRFGGKCRGHRIPTVVLPQTRPMLLLKVKLEITPFRTPTSPRNRAVLTSVLDGHGAPRDSLLRALSLSRDEKFSICFNFWKVKRITRGLSPVVYVVIKKEEEFEDKDIDFEADLRW